jgi:DNA-binding response OmpR family regulator
MYKFAAGRRFNILIVDGENLIADAIAIVFSNNGYNVRAAYSAGHANSLGSKWVPDFVIIDGCLPDTSGINFATKP